MFRRRAIQIEGRKRKNRNLEIHTENGVRRELIPFDAYDRAICTMLESEENITYVTENSIIKLNIK